MHIAFIASEATPYAKTGGLADVVGSLPTALTKLGHAVTVILPHYRALPSPRARVEVETLGDIAIPLGSRLVRTTIEDARAPADGIRVILVTQPEYFDRPGLYQNEHGVDYADNCERFVLFCKAALEAILQLDLRVDCIHAHDWHTGLAPVCLRHSKEYRGRFGGVGTVFSIHNMAFQGLFPFERFAVTGLPRSLLTMRQLEYYGGFSMLKGGILFSDMVTTVSRTYAEEIQWPEFGLGLEGVMRERAGRLAGIVNGVDYDCWNPQTDAALACHYDVTSWRRGKGECKRDLRQQIGLPDRDDEPVIGLVGRLTDQKGFDLLAGIADRLLAEALQVVVLGTGDAVYHTLLQRLEARHPAKLAARLTFDEQLARRIYAGADMFLMPSRFEPCGLSQLYSMRYGTVPIVRHVGGLADTVVDTTPASLASGVATGFQFLDDTPDALHGAVLRALQLYAEPSRWERVVRRGMLEDWSWEKSAREYAGVYERAIRLRRND